MNKKTPILGIIGGGQLGSMLCQAANKLNIQTTVLTDDKEAPAQNFCNNFIYTEYNSRSTMSITSRWRRAAPVRAGSGRCGAKRLRVS